ncbi:hypothetical protein APHNP_1287 [Anaplasma phagocytophilum str. ApNP]|uniref:Uncharacterized protein n=1 Tax=Anaplasma phagocytophilum str. ApNP TaxID=1359153 RepID=A0A0F3NE55_ANAPH|nr:hypothetical protein APHNP_1287 [Anaplasma phagocytophilum str. ApNP]
MQLLQYKMKQQSCDIAGWTCIRNRRGREVFAVITEIVAFVTLQDRNVSSTLVLSGLSHPILEENCNNVGEKVANIIKCIVGICGFTSSDAAGLKLRNTS